MEIPTRETMLSAFDAALDSIDPYASVERNLDRTDGMISAAGHSIGPFQASDIVVLGIGKASPAMANAVVDITGARRGLVVTPYPKQCDLELVVGGHPVPDASSIAAGESMARVARAVRSTDLVIAVVSGGGSSALDLPIDSVTLDDLRLMNEVLVTSGVPIEDINAVRAVVSKLKAGGLRRLIGSSVVLTLVLSDISSGRTELVSSGPTVGSDARQLAHGVVKRWRLAEALPHSVLTAIAGMSESALTPSADIVIEIGSPASAAAAAGRHLASKGYAVEVRTNPITGDVGTAVQSMLSPPENVTVVAAGEATVAVTGGGIGGRNQHAALLAAAAINGTDRRFGALGTDGVDGPTDAAGAIVDGTTDARAAAHGFDLRASIADCDSHRLLSAVGDTVVTGPTGTNAADVWIATPALAP